MDRRRGSRPDNTGILVYLHFLADLFAGRTCPDDQSPDVFDF